MVQIIACYGNRSRVRTGQLLGIKPRIRRAATPANRTTTNGRSMAAVSRGGGMDREVFVGSTSARRRVTLRGVFHGPRSASGTLPPNDKGRHVGDLWVRSSWARGP